MPYRVASRRVVGRGGYQVWAPSSGVSPSGPLFNDLFAGSADTALSSHTSDSGHAWSVHPSYAGTGTGHIVTSGVGTVRHSTTGTPATSAYVTSAALTTGYDIAFDFVVKTNAGSCGILFGFADAADTGYLFRVNGTTWGTVSLVASASTTLGTPHTSTPAAATTYAMKIEVRPTSIRVTKDTIEIQNLTSETTHARTGKLGVRFTNVSMTDTTGVHIDNLVVTAV